MLGLPPIEGHKGSWVIGGEVIRGRLVQACPCVDSTLEGQVALENGVPIH